LQFIKPFTSGEASCRKTEGFFHISAQGWQES
jgi:hypothetical protein